MLTRSHWNRSSQLALVVGLIGVGIGSVAGLLAGIQPVLLAGALVATILTALFFAKVELSIIGLLVLRSSLDTFSAQQLPALFAIGVDLLTILYVLVLLLTGKTVKTGRFWWFFAAWVASQGLWLLLMPLGGLGLDASYLGESIREWVRLFSWLMVYLLVMQLQDRIHPNQVISGLFLALVVPLTMAVTQLGGGRLRGTLGHSNTLATFLLLFISLTLWKLGHTKNRQPWLALLGVLAFFLVAAKALFSLAMLMVIILVLIAPRLSLLKIIGGLLLFVVVIGLFASTEVGRERLSSLSETPLLNPDIDISRAILLSSGDGNSFNWRLAHWYSLLQSWQYFPFFGYGLNSSASIGGGYLAHSDYVRALVEGGIVGFATFISFIAVQIGRLIWLMRRSLPGSRQRELCFVLLALLIAILVGMFTENIWSHTTLFFYWWTLSAVAGWDWKEEQLPESSPIRSNAQLVS